MPQQLTDSETRPQPQLRPQPAPRPQPVPAPRPKPVPQPRPKQSPVLQPQQQSPLSTFASPNTRTPFPPSKNWTPEQPGDPQQKGTPSFTPQQSQFGTPNNESVTASARSFRFFKPPTPDTPSSSDPNPYVYDSFDNIITSPWQNRRSRSFSDSDFGEPIYSDNRSLYRQDSRNKTRSEFGSVSSTSSFEDDDDSIYSAIPPHSKFGSTSRSPSQFGSPGPTADFEDPIYATVPPKSSRGPRNRSFSEFASPSFPPPSEDLESSEPPPLPLRKYLEEAPSQRGSRPPSGYSATSPGSQYDSGDIFSPSPSSSYPQFSKESPNQSSSKLYSPPHERPSDSFVESENIQFVNTANFNEIVGNKDLAMVLFYDPDIAQSQVTRKYFKKAADGKRYLNQQFAAVNCQVDGDFCAAHDATALPMYKIFSKGKLLTTVRETTRFTDTDMTSYMDKLLEVTKSPLQQNPNVQLKKRSKCSLAKMFGFKK